MSTPAVVPRRRPGRPRKAVQAVMKPIRMTPATYRELRIACAEDEMTNGEMIAALLRARRERIKARAAMMASPLHRPKITRLADLEFPR